MIANQPFASCSSGRSLCLKQMLAGGMVITPSCGSCDRYTRYMMWWVVVLSMSIAAYAERPSPGLKVGVPISVVCASESLGSLGSANVCADRYVVGPAVEVGLLRGLSLDVAALFTPVQLQGGARSAAGYPSFSTQRSGTAWEFPILAKYRLLRRLSPYVAIGPAFRRVGLQGQNTNISVSALPPGQIVTSVSEIAEAAWQAGWAIAGGIEFRTRFVRFSPELRHSRWLSGINCDDCGPFVLPIARSNSTVLLLGFGF